MILSSAGKPFKNKSGATNTIRIKNIAGEPVEIEGGWAIQANQAKDVKCPGCKQSFHETTDEYNPDTVANPSMLTLKAKYMEWGWENVPADATAGFGCLECPECGHPLAPNGKLEVI